MVGSKKNNIVNVTKNHQIQKIQGSAFPGFKKNVQHKAYGPNASFALLM